MHTNSYECEAALDTLATCMKYYGSWFAPHKLRVENFITNFLENSSEQVVESAAIAFHYFQQVKINYISVIVVNITLQFIFSDWRCRHRWN